LFSAILNAFTCSSVKSSAQMTGTSFNPNFSAALSLVCPAIIWFSLSKIIGFLKPYSFMLFATKSTALSFFLGLLE